MTAQSRSQRARCADAALTGATRWACPASTSRRRRCADGPAAAWGWSSSCTWSTCAVPAVVRPGHGSRRLVACLAADAVRQRRDRRARRAGRAVHPAAGRVVAAVAALRADREVLRARLREPGVRRRAPLGTDPARPVTPDQPAAALRRDGAALRRARLRRAGQGDDDGHRRAAGQPRRRSGGRLGGAASTWCASLVPVLVAVSAGSPYLGGRASGWHSMRQGTWQGIDHGAQRPGAGGGADRGVGDVRAGRAGDAGRATATSCAPVTAAGAVRRVARGRRAARPPADRWPTSTTT